MKYTYKRVDRSEVTPQLFQQIVDVENAEGDGYTKQQLETIWINDHKDDNFVCMDGEKVVGHISVNPLSKRRNGSVFVINLVVLPSYRRQGIAQNLILTAVKFYIKKGTKLPMSITVDKDNLPAIKLYQKVGFEIKQPICEIDQDDEQYILDGKLENIEKIIENITSESCCK